MDYFYYLKYNLKYDKEDTIQDYFIKLLKKKYYSLLIKPKQRFKNSNKETNINKFIK